MGNVELEMRGYQSESLFDGIIIAPMAANFKDVLAVYKEDCRACAYVLAIVLHNYVIYITRDLKRSHTPCIYQTDVTLKIYSWPSACHAYIIKTFTEL